MGWSSPAASPDIMKEAFMTLVGALSFLAISTILLCVVIAMVQVVINPLARADWLAIYIFFKGRITRAKRWIVSSSYRRSYKRMKDVA